MSGCVGGCSSSPQTSEHGRMLYEQFVDKFKTTVKNALCNRDDGPIVAAHQNQERNWDEVDSHRKLRISEGEVAALANMIDDSGDTLYFAPSEEYEAFKTSTIAEFRRLWYAAPYGSDQPYRQAHELATQAFEAIDARIAQIDAAIFRAGLGGATTVEFRGVTEAAPGVPVVVFEEQQA